MASATTSTTNATTPAAAPAVQPAPATREWTVTNPAGAAALRALAATPAPQSQPHPQANGVALQAAMRQPQPRPDDTQGLNAMYASAAAAATAPEQSAPRSAQAAVPQVAAQGQPSSQPIAAAVPGAQAPTREDRGLLQLLASNIASLHPSQGGTPDANTFMVVLKLFHEKRISHVKAVLKSCFTTNEAIVKYLEDENNDIFSIKKSLGIKRSKLERELFYRHVLELEPPPEEGEEMTLGQVSALAGPGDTFV